MIKNSDFSIKLIIIIMLSITIMLFFIGVINIINIGLPISLPVMVILFAITFVVGTLFSEKRNGEYPWTLVGGLIIAIIMTSIITCVFSGVMFSVKGELFKISTDILIYSISLCLIFSVITLNVINNLDIVAVNIKNRLFKDQPNYSKEQYLEDENPDDYRI